MKPLQMAKSLAGTLLFVALTTRAPVGLAQSSQGYNGGPASSVGQNEAKSLLGQRTKHETDLFTGSFVYSIPIEGAPARNNSQPMQVR